MQEQQMEVFSESLGRIRLALAHGVGDLALALA